MGPVLPRVGAETWRCILSIESQGAVDDLQLRLARMEGELEATRAQLAGLVAAESQWRIELEAAKEDAASCRSSLMHQQQQYEERLQSKGRRITDLEAELAEARRREGQAAHERAAVIAALGRRARKRLPDAGDE